jgi:phosphopantothenoylcysteine decarboxylase/phosphopantothenate--cysteine ligase
VLNNKTIVLGVTGSIAAYKSLELVRRLSDEGARVTVVMTEAAQRFITPFAFETVSGNRVFADLFSGYSLHINIAKQADLFIVAPATANTISKLACGIADDLLSIAWLACDAPLLIAPAMNWRMYKNNVIQENIEKLKKRGVAFVGPVSGDLACGEEGAGRMAEVQDILEVIKSLLSEKDLKGHSLLVTAGPTREYLDPVRFISNPSTGKMGFAIARVAQRRGADVCLISGPTSLAPPQGVSFVSVETTKEMEREVMGKFLKSTAVVMAAAVCDFAPAHRKEKKLPKENMLNVSFKKTPDIVKTIGKKKGNRFIVGFAAETGEEIDNARKKLIEKNLDLIVLNDITRHGAGFGSDTNIVSLIDREGEVVRLPLMSKEEVAHVILDRIKQGVRKK